MTQFVLLAGATGMLGGHLARHLLLQPDARLRLLVRDAHDPKKASVIRSLLALGAEVVEGDLADPESLDRATQGIDVIVSAVQGGPDVIVAGQVALAEAGKRNGVRRMLPSDFALDLFKAIPGQHAMFDARRQADEHIVATGLDTIHILQGGFMDLFLPGKGAVDDVAGTVNFWGDGTMPVEVTTVEDTARMTARVALDRDVPAGKFAFAGDRLSFDAAATVLEERTGRRYRRVSLGSEADLRAAHAAALLNPADPFKHIMLAYLLYMTTGQTALEDVNNTRYAGLKLSSFDEFVARTLPPSASA
jgi:uncharacterized protein YbjT (DUF2867 family)